MSLKDVRLLYIGYAVELGTLLAKDVDLSGKRGLWILKKRKNMGKRKRNRIAMALIGVIALFLLSFLLYQRNKAQEQIARYNAQEVALKEKIEAENARTKEIDQLKEYMKTYEYAEEVAREKLGLVKDNEVVFQESSESGS